MVMQAEKPQHHTIFYFLPTLVDNVPLDSILIPVEVETLFSSKSRV